MTAVRAARAEVEAVAERDGALMVIDAVATSFAGFASFRLRTRTVIGAGPIPAAVKRQLHTVGPGNERWADLAPMRRRHRAASHDGRDVYEPQRSYVELQRDVVDLSRDVQGEREH